MRLWASLVKIAPFLWMILAALAGMTPERYHRPIAYGLMAAFVPLAVFIAHDIGLWAATGFFAIALFQLRLLLLSWLRKLYQRIRR